MNTPLQGHANEQVLREQMLAGALQLDAVGLNRGSTGNLSVRAGDHWLVTPSGIAAQDLSPQSMVRMDFNGEPLGPGKPSSEWRFHRDILVTRHEVAAIVHTHSRFATAFSCLHREIPAFHYMIAIAGGDSIRCAPYALFGTQALSDLAIEALQHRKACLLGNHGLIALGADLKRAMAVAIEVESLCEQYWTALQLGEPQILSAEQMQLVHDKFKPYGQTNR
ncbi:MAG: class II aldolase [Limnohabitans sp.]|nr:class II aldolase [Limnohabitans sp.]